VQAVLQESTPPDVGVKAYSHESIQIAYSGKVSIHLDESLGLLFILAGYFRPASASSAYSEDAKDLLPLFAQNNDPLKDDFEGCFSLAVCNLNSFDVLLMTDRFGTRPLYYSYGEQYIAVSSETFLLLPWVQTLSVSSAALTDSFWLGFCRAPESMISGIVKVHDNGVVKITSGRVIENHVKPYPLVIEPDNTLEFSSVVSRIEKALEQEFTNLGKTARKVAVLLSGGVDSSIMAAYAKKHFADCVAFSCEIEGFDNPELERAVYVAEKLGLRHEIVRLNLDDLGRIFADVVSMLEGPSRHINNIVVRRIFEEIKDYDAIIGGDGADALFGTKTNRTIVNIEKKTAFAGRVPDRLKPIISMILDRLSPRKRDHLKRILANDLESLLSNLFTIDYEEQQVSVARKLGVSQFSGIPLNAYESSNIIGKSLEANTSLFLRCMLERNGKLSNDSAIPIYYPFLSQGMVEVARKLPLRLRFDDAGNAKPALREIFRRLVDSSAIEWPKIGFVTPEKPWLTDQLKPYLDNVLANRGGISKVLGMELDRGDISTVQSSPRLMWWLMTLDSGLLEMEAAYRRWKQE
jgi:asparagine synthase (glutamine-hydrolysing)